MNGQEILLLPSVHATTSAEQKSHLHQVQQRIEQHILQYVADQIRQHDDDLLNRDEMQHSQPKSSLESATQLQLLQHQLQQSQQFMGLLKSSSSSPSSPFDSIFRSPSSPSKGNRQNEPSIDRGRQKSIASLSAVAQEFLSQPNVVPMSPNTSRMMAQLAGVALDTPHAHPMDSPIIEDVLPPLPAWQPQALESSSAPEAHIICSEMDSLEFDNREASSEREQANQNNTNEEPLQKPNDERYSDNQLGPQNSMLSETCSSGRSDIRDINLLRPVLMNHWLFY